MVDLALGHVSALAALEKPSPIGCQSVNLGTGNGVSVLELVSSMSR